MQDDVLNHWLDAAAVPAKGMNTRYQPTEAAAQELARLNDLLALTDFKVEARLVPQVDENILAIINFSAKVTQKCVVSLEPVLSDIDETVRLLYTPEAALQTDGLDIDFDEDDDEDRESLIDGKINLGAAVAEHFALALNPYPRRPGVSLPDEVVGEEHADTRDNPFAVLGRLKRDTH